MRQDTDVARMAAALRTPSLKYRSFGNEPVRHASPAPAATEEQAFSILGDALAGASDLPPETVLGHPEPLPTEAPMLPVGDAYATHQVAAPQAYPIAPNPHVELQRAPAPIDPPPLPEPVIPPAPLPVAPPVAVEAPMVPAHAPTMPRPAVPPEAQGQSLLQVLLGGQVPPAFPVAPQAVPPAPPPPVAAAIPESAPQPVVPMPAAAAPMVPQAPPMPMLAALAAESSPAMVPMRLGGSTGSSLLDALMGFGPGAGAAAIHYPLLDSLGDAMRGNAGDPSPRHWPAARVDIALPELLRRVAAGVRFARTAA